MLLGSLNLPKMHETPLSHDAWLLHWPKMRQMLVSASHICAQTHSAHQQMDSVQ